MDVGITHHSPTVIDWVLSALEAVRNSFPTWRLGENSPGCAVLNDMLCSVRRKPSNAHLLQPEAGDFSISAATSGFLVSVRHHPIEDGHNK